MDDIPRDADASPGGIADCLRMLADEAASLRLVRTLVALLETMEICRIEASAMAPQSAAALASEPAEPELQLH